MFHDQFDSGQHSNNDYLAAIIYVVGQKIEF